MDELLFSIKNCRIENSKNVLIKNISWEMKVGEVWLVTGGNKSTSSIFLESLSGDLKIIPNENDSFYSSSILNSLESVSLEKAALLIQYEKENDESDYIEGGVDIGRTARVFIQEVREEKIDFENDEIVNLLGIKKILDRGIKYLSTGEVRKVMLCRVLLSRKKLLILNEIFAGLDVGVKEKLNSFFEKKLQNSENDFPNVIIGQENVKTLPSFVTHVAEFQNGQLFFCGTKENYISNTEREKKESSDIFLQDEIVSHLNKNYSKAEVCNSKNVLVQMNNVNVRWGENHVIRNFSWTLFEGEHWLVRGPNGSGKTTFLELITGDNMQVYSNDVTVLGIKRGSGETLWDIKSKLGIVSYRLHVEYRMLASTSLLDVILSGFKDSIGLYEKVLDSEKETAKAWLSFGGFLEKMESPFSSLSYGEQRSLLILRSCVKSPKILILDEPCHALDSSAQKKVLLLLEEIAKLNTTTLLHVTHEEDEVLPLEKNILEFRPNENPMYKITEL